MGLRMIKLTESIKRHKVTNIKPLICDITSDELPKANKILIDVPCSGTGVINRRVDLRWKRTLNDIEKSLSVQYNILEHASKFLLDDGILVYSTCSIEPEENMMVIHAFLKSHPNFSIESAENYLPVEYVDKHGAMFTYPPDHKIDGGFAVRLKNNG